MRSRTGPAERRSVRIAVRQATHPRVEIDGFLTLEDPAVTR